MAPRPFDFAIVGGGAAGCVPAKRLTADPRIRFGPEGRRRRLDARIERELMAQPAREPLTGGESLPGPEARSDDEVGAGLHLTSSARMATEESAVVHPATPRVPARRACAPLTPRSGRRAPRPTPTPRCRCRRSRRPA